MCGSRSRAGPPQLNALRTSINLGIVYSGMPDLLSLCTQQPRSRVMACFGNSQTPGRSHKPGTCALALAITKHRQGPPLAHIGTRKAAFQLRAHRDIPKHIRRKWVLEERASGAVPDLISIMALWVAQCSIRIYCGTRQQPARS